MGFTRWGTANPSINPRSDPGINPCRGLEQGWSRRRRHLLRADVKGVRDVKRIGEFGQRPAVCAGRCAEPGGKGEGGATPSTWGRSPLALVLQSISTVSRH
jgi:hypothetical protein